MLDFSWAQILLVAVVALMVVRPKDLPQALKVVAQFARKARGMAREFQSGLEEMVREAELHEVKRDIENMASTDFDHELEHSIDPGGTVAKSLDLEAETAALPAPESDAALAPPPAAAEAAESAAVPAPEPAEGAATPSPSPAAEPAPAAAPAAAAASEAAQPAPLVQP